MRFGLNESIGVGFAAVLALGCGNESGSETGGTTASLGCAEGTLAPDATHVDLRYDGVDRSYELYLPSAYDGSTPLPVVLNFHGFTSTGLGQQEFSGMDATAEREGFLVVYPNGLDNSWNAGICCGRSAETGVDDIGFTRAVIDDLGARGCIDTARVYATGMSNGGFLTHRLACEAADVIAAAAPVAAVLGIEESACNPSRPIPIIQMNGTADPLVAYEGGGLAESPGAQESIDGWVARDGCTGTPVVTYENGAATCETVSECDGEVSVTLCSIEGAGHCWPGQPCRLDFFGEPTFDIDANEVMWDVFRDVALP
jgi:polyhydroxybutyrate depolymerase